MQASRPMTAAEVLAAHIWSTVHYQCSCGGEDGDTMTVAEHAQHQHEALNAAGYALVHLPKPSDIADDWVLHGEEIRRYVPDGFGAYITFTIDEAATWALALLSLIAVHEAAGADR